MSMIDFVGKLLEDSKKNTALFFLRSPDGKCTLGWNVKKFISASGPTRIELLQAGIQRENPNETWLGGVKFFQEAYSARSTRNNPWQGIPESIFFLPENYIETEEKKYPSLADSRVNTPISHLDDGAEQGIWHTNIQKIMDLIQREAIQKVVLSRQAVYTCAQTLPLAEIWKAFSQNDFSSAHLFCFLWDGTFFFGASPELLFEQEGSTIVVPAIAGTRERGKTPADDVLLAEELIHSAKEQEEHSYVVQFVRDRMQALGGSLLSEESAQILKLKHVQHLYTKNVFRFSEQPNPLQVLKTLHPTPAMAGFPQIEALRFLWEQENYERGYYASPLGLLNLRDNRAKFIVAIRCALVAASRLHVFAGAGIVRSSVADAEWRETKQKMRTVLQSFVTHNP